MRQALTSVQIGILANPLRFQRLLRVSFAVLLTLLVILVPQISQAGNDVSIVTGTEWLTTQFKSGFKTARLVILGIVILYTFIKGWKAFTGDDGAWKQVIAGIFVAFFIYNPNWIIKVLTGTTISSDFTEKGLS